MKKYYKPTLKIERWIERGTKAWENFLIRNKGLGTSYSSFLLGLLGWTYHIRDGEINEKSSSALQPIHSYSSSHPLYSSPLTMSSSSSSGSNRMRTVRRRMLEGAREVTPFIFNENDYQVGPFSSYPYLIDRLMIIVFSFRSLWAVSIGRFVLRSDRYPSSGGKVQQPFQRGLCIGGPSCGSSSALSGYGISLPEGTLGERSGLSASASASGSGDGAVNGVSLGARAYGNGCLHVGNISGFVTKFFQCSNQIHFIHISNVTSTFACDVITSNISVTFEM